MEMIVIGFSAGGKGVRRPWPVEDGENMLLG